VPSPNCRPVRISLLASSLLLGLQLRKVTSKLAFTKLTPVKKRLYKTWKKKFSLVLFLIADVNTHKKRKKNTSLKLSTDSHFFLVIKGNVNTVNKCKQLFCYLGTVSKGTLC